MSRLWGRAAQLLLYGWLPAGIAWQLANADRIDAYSMLGWFLWPIVPLGYLAAAWWHARRTGK